MCDAVSHQIARQEKVLATTVQDFASAPAAPERSTMANSENAASKLTMRIADTSLSRYFEMIDLAICQIRNATVPDHHTFWFAG